MTRIIQLSDPHIVPEGELAYGQVETSAPLKSCVETINRILPNIGPIDMVIVTGDLTDYGTAEEYQRFRDIMEPLKIPYRVIPGNHDNVNVMRANFSDHEWMPKSGPINWTAEFTDLALIALDTNIADQDYGNLSDQSLSYLHDKLADLNNKSVIVAIHHPPILTGMKTMDKYNLRDSEKLKGILSEFPGELKLVCGHMHRNITAFFGSVICQISPGTSHCVNMDFREDAPHSLIREPGAFLLHEMRGGIMTHTIPIGYFGETHLFYPKSSNFS